MIIDDFNVIKSGLINYGEDILIKSIKGFDIYGSAINGLALRGNSDIDISVNINDKILTDKEALLLIQKAFLKLNCHDSNPYLFIDVEVFDASYGSQMTFTV